MGNHERRTISEVRLGGKSPGQILGRALIPLLSRQQAFLDRPVVPLMLAAAPIHRRRNLAIRLLGLSPHFSDHPVGAARIDVLEREFNRNVASRRAICANLIRPSLVPGMSLLDFGCGPGYLAKAVSEFAGQVIGVDVSRGVIACAQVLNAAPNISYRVSRDPNITCVPDEEIDFVYSIAVLQHLDKKLTRAVFKGLHRVLKPGGVGVCHFMAGDTAAALNQGELTGWEKWLKLRMVTFTPAEMAELAGSAGFTKIVAEPIARRATIDDDVGRQHVVYFEKPTR